MLVLEYKLVAAKAQAERVHEGIRVVQFIRNKALRLWMDTNAKPYDLNRYCAVLAKEYAFANALNSQARQPAAERAAYAISRYLKPDKSGKQLKRPKFQKNNRSIEYKTTGWRLSEDLQVRNLVKNRSLAKSIHDAAWSLFKGWLLHYGQVFGRPVMLVPPAYTSQDCSACGKRVKKALSERTHVCSCGLVMDRDENAARNILRLGLALLELTYRRAYGNVEGLPSETLGEMAPLLPAQAR